MEAILIFVAAGVATGMVGKAKGSSFFLWLLIGTFVPFLGFIAACLQRNEDEEPERRCPRCGVTHKLYVQVCSSCGEDMYLPAVSETRPGPAFRPPRPR